MAIIKRQKPRHTMQGRK